MTKRRLFFLMMIFTYVICLSPNSLADYEIDLTANPIMDTLGSMVGHREEDTIEVYDEGGNYIFSSSMGVSVGDRYITEDNREFEVITVESERATAKDLGVIDLLGDEKTLGAVNTLPPLVQGKNNKTIGLYHTHSAESYKPGPAFQDNRGEIYDVGTALKNQLEQKGIKVIQSEDTFLPHDGGAYDRSRGTAASLLKDGADAIFDVHRDAIPRARDYVTQVQGEEMTKVRLVVGRQNPNMGPNDQMAKRLKAIADEKYPGLIKGIFYAKGKYNQDLSPKSLLFEFGTHVTTEDAARRSTAALADSINILLYGSKASVGGGKQGTDQAMGSASWKNLLWVVGILVVGVIGFLFINEKGLSGVGGRLKEFTGEEFANILGRSTQKRKKQQKRRKNNQGKGK